MLHSAYLSLGSNIDPLANIPLALKLLSARVNLLEVSSAWSTKAVGTNGPDFVNLAVHVRTDDSLEALKNEILRKIEQEMGRIRTDDKFAPRTIDLDITLFDDVVVDANLCHLDYLILPLAELLPDYSPKTEGKTLRELARLTAAQSSAKRLPHFPITENSKS